MKGRASMKEWDGMKGWDGGEDGTMEEKDGE